MEEIGTEYCEICRKFGEEIDNPITMEVQHLGDGNIQIYLGGLHIHVGNQKVMLDPCCVWVNNVKPFYEAFKSFLPVQELNDYEQRLAQLTSQ